MNITIDTNTLKAITHVVDRIGVVAFSAVTGGIVALTASITWGFDDRLNIIIGAAAAMIPPLIVWGKQSLLEYSQEARRWEEIRIKAEFEEKSRTTRADKVYKLDLVRIEHEEARENRKVEAEIERSLWNARNRYMELSIQKEELGRARKWRRILEEIYNEENKGKLNGNWENNQPFSKKRIGDKDYELLKQAGIIFISNKKSQWSTEKAGSTIDDAFEILKSIKII